jgi:hypothetical protein
MPAEGWLEDIQAAHKRSTYCEDVLMVLGGMETIEAEPGMKLLVRRKRAQQFALEDRLIWQAAIVKLDVPKEL